MNIGNVLFSPNGRIGQQSYWIGVLILIGANILLTWIPLLGFLVWLGLWYVGFCVYGKRLHDIGKSMWIHALVVLVSFVISIIAGVMVGGSIFALAMSGNGEPDPAAIMSMIGSMAGVFIIPTLLWLGYTIWLGVASGTVGDNRYGAPEGTAAPAAAPAAPAAPTPSNPTVTSSDNNPPPSA